MNRKRQHALHNHTILLILIFNLPIQLLDINFYLIFFSYGSVQPSQPIICLLWWLTDYGFYMGGLILMACSPCYESYGILGMWEFIGHISIPILLEGIASITLILRVQMER
ncbi:unnamed protein product [Adineta steineri]|uniref:Uncharacterized protein n=1 Tax=Adineta steineri TaxID=433720 RepID=A0A820MUA7_9BILA|nr:unnamed protein product [Adineta steineri]